MVPYRQSVSGGIGLFKSAAGHVRSHLSQPPAVWAHRAYSLAVGGGLGLLAAWGLGL
jgi:hypothetical protein